jgi:tRNA (5-methylaminomethyl-2-thiouridylate)-methyltransferase
MKVAVLVSGGVDSAVALRLLKEQGHDVTAYYLKIWLEDELAYLGDCPWEEDLSYVHAICEQADVPLKIINLQKEYHEKVVGYAIGEIKTGRTPNPDIFCNKLIKFGAFLDHIDARYDKIASGHYAQIKEQDGVFKLMRAPDPIKDQTYFLSSLTQDQLSRLMFPIGHLEKSEVRALANQYDLPNKDRKDSQGICFLGTIKFRDFIKHNVGTQKGDIIEVETGTKMGEHEGFWFYTIGQRSGIGLSGGPWYVVSKDTAQNIVYISRHYYAEDKKRDKLTIGSFNPTAGMSLEDIMAPRYNADSVTRVEVNNNSISVNSSRVILSNAKNCIEGPLKVKLRHGPDLVDCAIKLISDKSATITLAEDDQGIAPGQFAVLYSGQLCLGSGVIE